MRKRWLSDVTRHTSWILGLGLVFACGDGGEAPATVVVPASTERLSLETSVVAVDAAVASVAMTETLGVMFGGPSGLWQRRPDGGLRPIDPAPVHAVSAFGEVVLVARDDGLFVYDGTWTPSPLSAMLDAAPRALASTGTALWIGHSGLDEVRDGQRTRWWTGDALHITTYAGANAVLVHDAVAAHLVDLQQQTVATLDAPGPVALGPDDRVFAAGLSELYERVIVGEGEVAWRPVDFGAEPGSATDGLTPIATDPATGAIWFDSSTDLVRIDRTGFARYPRPALGALAWAAIDDVGVVWLGDGSQLARLGPTESRDTVTWINDIAPFSADNCERCHQALGTSFPLDTYDAWASRVDDIIDVLTSGRMPLDGAPLVGGSVTLVEQWKQDGLQE